MNSRLYRLARISEWDLALCVRVNRVGRYEAVRRAFRVVSKLGDGVFWYVLILALALSQVRAAQRTAVHMTLMGLVCTAVYKWLKKRTLRPRPFEVNPHIVCGAKPLDQFSFPSGHTLHAVAFTAVAGWYFPGLLWLLVPFSSLVALSRVTLGLHYPSDVVAGAALGAVIAYASIALPPLL